MRRLTRLAPVAALGLAAVAILLGAGSAGAGTKAFVGCGSVLTSSYKLLADMSCYETTGLEVGANGITIDLNGHTIKDAAGGDAGDYGIDVNGHSKVTIKGGKIENFATGIYT